VNERMKRPGSITPLIFTIAGSIGIGTLAVYHLAAKPDGVEKSMQCAAFLLYGVWMVWESRISIGELKKTGAEHDRSTLELCAIVKLLLLTAVFAADGRMVYPGLGVGGMMLILVGILLRIAAVHQLGRSYSHRIRDLESPLISRGLYGTIRHPAYLGTLLVHAGVVALFLNPFSLIMLGIWFMTVVTRTKVEDRWLSTFPEYREYARKVRWKLFPGVF